MKESIKKEVIDKLENELNKEFPEENEVKLKENGLPEPICSDKNIYENGKKYGIVVGLNEEEIEIGNFNFMDNTTSKKVEGKVKLPLKDNFIGNLFKKISSYTPGPSELTNLPRCFEFCIEYDKKEEDFEPIDDFNLKGLTYL